MVTVDGDVFVRSVQGEESRWYQRITANPETTLHAGERRIPVSAFPATDEPTVEKVSAAYRSKYGRTSPGSTQAMVRPGILSTTLRLEPA